jgi:hypothetical protein
MTPRPLIPPASRATRAPRVTLATASRAPRITATRVTRIVALTGLAVAAIASCARLEPDVGPELAGACSNDTVHPEVTVSFSGQIRPLLNRMPGGCACHMPTSAGLGPATQIVGLNLSSLTLLRAGGVTSGAQIVVAGEPCSSVIYQKTSDAPPFGSRMPLNGPPYMTPDEHQLLHDWIAEGANDN